jgi:hypothetical protein
MMLVHGKEGLMQNDMEWECERPEDMNFQVPFNVHGHG